MTDCECVGWFLCVCEGERERVGGGERERGLRKNTQEKQIGVKSLRSISVDRPLYGCLIVSERLAEH